MNERTMIDFFSLQNGWWHNGPPKSLLTKVKPFKRRDYHHLLENELETQEALVIIGPRGVGKSTVVHEIIRELLGLTLSKDGALVQSKEGIDKRRILYLSFEPPVLQKLKILDVVKAYAKYVLREDLSQLNQKTYVFFDEMQNIEDWGDQLKHIQDLGLPIKFVISGSSSVKMIDEASKGARRFKMYSMHPLKFSDFLRANIDDEKFHEVLGKFKMMRSDFIAAIEENDAKSIFDKFLQMYNDLKPWQTNIELLFQEYMIKGGYPEFLKTKDYSKCTASLFETFWLGLHKDSMLGSGIDPKAVAELVEYVARTSSCETNYESLKKNSKATSNQDVLKKYLYHLENSYLINYSYPFSRSPSRKSEFKLYLTDIAIKNLLNGQLNELLFRDELQMGYTIETLVFDHALRFYYKIRPHTHMQYKRGGNGSGEIDIILKLNGKNIAIEVKKGDQPSLSEVSALREFTEKHGVPGFVLGGQKMNLEENVVFLPHWLFILLC